MKKTYTCWTDDPEDTRDVSAFDEGMAVEEYAEYCWDNCDGIEWMTPDTVFHVSNGECVKEFTVEIDFSPSFYARLKEEV